MGKDDDIVLRFVIHYGYSLNEALAQAGLNKHYQANEQLLDLFSKDHSGQGDEEVEAKLFQIEEGEESYCALSVGEKIKRERFNPAGVKEIIAFAGANPKEPFKDLQILALGVSWASAQSLLGVVEINDYAVELLVQAGEWMIRGANVGADVMFLKDDRFLGIKKVKTSTGDKP